MAGFIINAMSQEREAAHERGTVAEVARPETQPPPRYAVLMLNDDFTPMDFVVEVLTRFFAMDLEKATQIMLHVHTRGQAVCGTYSRDVAESKAGQVNEYARVNQHPLLCRVEKA